ncbi:MAG TPA: DNA repair protein RecO [Pirellulales bacterium]|jgi:DNA repair protein RecO (recombination protein O)|nr:DNA repair protein RecO [Pirellulales bacterium]
MSAEKALALVLRVVDFSETSCVVTLFTREFGKVRALAKGARRLKGPFESALDLLAQCRIVFLRKSSESLDLLTEAKLERRFRAADRDLSSLYAGYYVAELLNELTDDADPHPELFDVAVETLTALANGVAPVAALILRFEMMALRLLGHLPSLDACVDCGAEAPTTGRAAFGLLAGGVLCTRCRPGKRQVVSIHAGSLRVMQHFADPQCTLWRKMEIDRSLRGELRGVVNQYLCHLLGRRPRMHGYLGILAS